MVKAIVFSNFSSEGFGTIAAPRLEKNGIEIVRVVSPHDYRVTDLSGRVELIVGLQELMLERHRVAVRELAKKTGLPYVLLSKSQALWQEEIAAAMGRGVKPAPPPPDSIPSSAPQPPVPKHQVGQFLTDLSDSFSRGLSEPEVLQSARGVWKGGPPTSESLAKFVVGLIKDDKCPPFFLEWIRNSLESPETSPACKKFVDLIASEPVAHAWSEPEKESPAPDALQTEMEELATLYAMECEEYKSRIHALEEQNARLASDKAELMLRLSSDPVYRDHVNLRSAVLGLGLLADSGAMGPEDALKEILAIAGRDEESL